MANRKKTERNEKIWQFYQRGYRQIAIANMFKMTIYAVNMVIHRERKRRNEDEVIADNMRDVWKHQRCGAE